MVPANRLRPILVIEDSDEDFEAFERIIRQSTVPNPIYRCLDGDEALDLLSDQGDSGQKPLLRPAIILLDLNLPGTDGRDVLQQLKQNDQLQTIPVIVFTTSSNPRDIEVCYKLGVNGYVLKPMDIAKLRRTLQIFVDYWFEAIVLPDGLSAP